MRVAALIPALAVLFHETFVLAAQTVTVIVAPQGRLEYDPPYVRMGPGDKVLFIL
jgi:plastocyanin